MDQLEFYSQIAPITIELPRKIRYGIRTYLRYPGGKSKAVKDMIRYFPQDFDEYRETMLGGGSVFLHMKKRYPDRKYWINDIYTNLYLFWIACRDYNDELVDSLLKIKSDTTKDTSGDKFQEIKEIINDQDDITRAAYFYYLNKCSFSGLTESGTCSPQAWEQNFSQSSIESLHDLRYFLRDVRITNFDYNDLLLEDGKNVFIYLDPPYDIGKTNVLYGRNGEAHRDFDHIRFAEDVGKCKHKVMVSYNDSDTLRDRFSAMKIHTMPLKYTMRIINKGAPKKNELVMVNYE